MGKTTKKVIKASDLAKGIRDPYRDDILKRKAGPIKSRKQKRIQNKIRKQMEEQTKEEFR